MFDKANQKGKMVLVTYFVHLLRMKWQVHIPSQQEGIVASNGLLFSGDSASKPPLLFHQKVKGVNSSSLVSKWVIFK